MLPAQADRPADDQLELANGFSPGLLRHHCCFPNCPIFLKDLRTPRDRAAAAAAADAQTAAACAARARHHGLICHLTPFFHPDRTYSMVKVAVLAEPQPDNAGSIWLHLKALGCPPHACVRRRQTIQSPPTGIGL